MCHFPVDTSVFSSLFLLKITRCSSLEHTVYTLYVSQYSVILPCVTGNLLLLTEILRNQRTLVLHQMTDKVSGRTKASTREQYWSSDAEFSGYSGVYILHLYTCTCIYFSVPLSIIFFDFLTWCVLFYVIIICEPFVHKKRCPSCHRRVTRCD